MEKSHIRRELTKKVLQLPRTGIRAVDCVHQMIYDYRMEGSPLGALTLKPDLFDLYAFWCSKVAGRERVYNSQGEVGAPIECDGVRILKGEAGQKWEIIPKLLPKDDKAAQQWREYMDKHGKFPEHHSQVN